MAITLVQMSSQTQKMEGAAVGQLTQFSMITEDASQLQKEYVEDGGFPIYLPKRSATPSPRASRSRSDGSSTGLKMPAKRRKTRSSICS